jgi:hypothetical protein
MHHVGCKRIKDALGYGGGGGGIDWSCCNDREFISPQSSNKIVASNRPT